MSQEMIVVENERGEWFYILEDKNAPKDSWDWMEHAQCFGPFSTIGEALQHEYESESDTSGYEIVGHGVRDLGETGNRLIAEASAKSRPAPR